LIPLGSRIRVRMPLESATKEQLEQTLNESVFGHVKLRLAAI